MMQNGLALQAGTSHDLGQNFGKAFDVKFQNKEGQLDYVWQTSWGVSTRLDRRADHEPLRRQRPGAAAEARARSKPWSSPSIARTKSAPPCSKRPHKIAEDIGAKVDDREGQTPGAKFYHWERRGVPLVLELGPRDLASGNVVLKRRDTGRRKSSRRTDIAAKVPAALEQMQAELYAAAKKRLQDNTVLANSIEEVEEILHPVTAEKGGGKFRDGAHERRSALRRSREGIQGDHSLHPAG